MRRRRRSNGGLMPYAKRAGKGAQARRAKKIARRKEERKVVPSG